jgi:hypothetical protein
MPGLVTIRCICSGIGVDGPDPAQLARPVRPSGEGGFGDGQGDLPGEPGRTVVPWLDSTSQGSATA